MQQWYVKPSSAKQQKEKGTAKGVNSKWPLLRKEIWERRREMGVGGVNATDNVNNERLVEKQVWLLENKLDQTLVKFNKCVSCNKRLQEEINGLRGERVTFEKVYRKIGKVFHLAIVKSRYYVQKI